MAVSTVSVVYAILGIGTLRQGRERDLVVPDFGPPPLSEAGMLPPPAPPPFG